MREHPSHPYFGSEATLSPDKIPDVHPKRSFTKAISWRMVGTLDTLVLSFLILTYLGPLLGMTEGSHAENAKTATFIALTEVVTKMVLYYLHERGWERARWGVSRDGDGHRKESAFRSALKTGTWRVTASVDTMILALVFTGNLGTAISIGGLEVITKLVLYYFHERGWSRIKWGMTAP